MLTVTLLTVQVISGHKSLEILFFVQHTGPLPRTGPDFPS
jgi:hypothetical protein